MERLLMDFSGLPLFGAITRKMAWLADRQRVLSQNIANVNTPHYRANDLKPLDFGSELAQAGGRLELASTNPQHISMSSSSNGALANADLRQTMDDRTIAGNTVSMEDELMKVSDTGAQYQLMTNLYKKQLGMLKEAIGRGSGS